MVVMMNKANVFYFRVLFFTKIASVKMKSCADVAQIRVDPLRRLFAL